MAVRTIESRGCVSTDLSRRGWRQGVEKKAVVII